MDKPVIVIGATGATGSAICEKLHQDNIPLHLIARDPSALTTLAQKFNASFAIADVTDTEQLQQAIKDGIQNGCSGLVYCVGSIVIKPLARANVNDFMDCFKLNTIGAAIAIQSAANALKQSKGSVVLFSSVAAQYGFTNHAVISSAKAAIEGLTRSLACELAPHVRVNAIAPSLTESKMSKSFFDQPKIIEEIAKTHPLKRLGAADDLANLAVFLLSNQSEWITGQVIAVDGGRSTLR